MTKRLTVLGVTLLLFTACHGYTTPRFDPALYSQSRQLHDLTFFWKVDKTADAIGIAGFVKNNRYAYVDGLKLTISLLDERGKILSEAPLSFAPTPIPMDGMAPFSLTLPVKPGEKPVKVRFLYRYREIEAGFLKETYFNLFEDNLP